MNRSRKALKRRDKNIAELLTQLAKAERGEHMTGFDGFRGFRWVDRLTEAGDANSTRVQQLRTSIDRWATHRQHISPTHVGLTQEASHATA